MEVGSNLIGIFKTNTKVFYKDTTENLTKYWTRGSYLVLRAKPVVPIGRLLIAIGYKYNAQMDLSLIVTDNTGITQAGITYLIKNPDQFYNVSILPVSCTLFMYNFSWSVNEIKPYNKSMQSDLELETFWVTQCCWI